MNENKIESEVQQSIPEEKEEILQNFEQFKDYLGDKVAKGEKLGMSEETLAKYAEKVGDYLAAKEDPRNREEKLLQELWQLGDQEQRHHLAHMLVRLAQSTN
ncbi:MULTISPECIES: DUF3243 domain-containing protein [Alkalihalophilus]|uniref:DUF3243 domain-containing protein n=3 Tax=Alkalihalophilus TaxID=2893060 RepID=D3FY73_ALKPO|nr:MULTISPECIES: DUF3243 domain-containing protein [Alkalihalophilus]ADC49096.1 hypothetical protein BpOF4_05170 [Alkalihalophilus pseudofirmus OF4]ERN52287.1 hypothetical protein A33I_17420 [Alkalihalophilus marmarensis DSM 21297]MDV2886195.1 DUF3243 domain-containing protein [Alkalihalophilus pseudofirmus]MEC2071179.1 DUF3243 domain-containing protein [Alkalihalophilus marmarensis]MED1600008.1 DUF3243 domain-containing protein [Alkalihalophilus marmarensis]